MWTIWNGSVISWDGDIRRQSEHFADYRAAVDSLEAEGLVYRAYLSRSEIRRRVEAHENGTGAWPRDPDGAPVYPGGPHETGDDDTPYVLRLDARRAAERVRSPQAWDEEGSGPDGETGVIEASPERWGDVILARRDTPTSYNLSVVVDDALQGVTHVVRGRDLFHATSIHVVLQELLGLVASALFPSRPGGERGRAETVEEQPRHEPQGAARSGGDPAGYPADDRAGRLGCLSGQVSAQSDAEKETRARSLRTGRVRDGFTAPVSSRSDLPAI